MGQTGQHASRQWEILFSPSNTAYNSPMLPACGKAVSPKVSSLIADIAAKNFYGSDALKNVAEPWLR